jgi:DNA-binding winged helix-turn-helix (wHTH) protein/Tfp pilus assembly protein PilF
MSVNSSPLIARFGTFDINFQTGELRQRGQRVKLQEQPLQVLAALLERPGELVTREELHRKLWASDTFVDFDHGLNAAIKRLRDALGESADAPVFIETLARRGYRFIAPVSSPSRRAMSEIGIVATHRITRRSASNLTRISEKMLIAVDNRPSRVYEFGEFRLESGRRLLLRRDGAPVQVTAKAYDTLVYLVEHSGSVLAKEELMQALWPDTAVEENNLTQNISILRRVLRDGRSNRRYIATVPGRGYQFVASVMAIDAPAPARSEMPSVAVLPFVNVGGNPDNEYFADGLADELISALSKLPGVRVAARTSAFSFKGRQAHVREIASQLSVTLVLEGSVRKSGNRLRVSAQLVNAADGYQLWSDRYDREIEMRDLLDVQDEITVAVIDALKLKLPRSGRAAALKHSTENIHAHELYLKGRFHLFHMTEAGIEAGIGCFRKAIEIDPSYAPAHVGLAHAHRMFGLSLEMPACEIGPKAKETALKAIEIDPDLAEAHAVLAFTLYWYEWDMNGATRHFQRALELNPESADALWMYAHLPSNFGCHEEALRLTARARQLDPLSGLINAMEGQFLLHGGQVSGAILRLQEALELNPKSRVAHIFLASAYIEQGKYDDAVAEARASHGLAPANTQSLAFEGYAHAKAGRQTEARAIIDRLLELERSRYVPPQHVALIHNALDQHDAALEWLERAVKQRDPKLVFLKVEPKWKNLHDESRFRGLLQHINLLSAWPPAS